MRSTLFWHCSFLDNAQCPSIPMISWFDNKIQMYINYIFSQVTHLGMRLSIRCWSVSGICITYLPITYTCCIVSVTNVPLFKVRGDLGSRVQKCIWLPYYYLDWLNEIVNYNDEIHCHFGTVSTNFYKYSYQFFPIVYYNWF